MCIMPKSTMFQLMTAAGRKTVLVLVNIHNHSQVAGDLFTKICMQDLGMMLLLELS